MQAATDRNRWAPRALAAAWVLAVLAWLAYLARQVPSVSRGDFFLAMVRVAQDVAEGNWLDALSWPLHILGGHIVFYTRVLQLVNYYGFDYSPQFVKTAAILLWVAVAWGLWRLVARQALDAARAAALLALLGLVTFVPTPWEVLAWPDSTVPYLSCLIVLLFAGDPIVRRLQSPGRNAPALLGLCALVVIGSGVGWAILPTLLWILAASRMAQGRDVGRLVRVGLTAAAILAVFLAVMWQFAPTLRMTQVQDAVRGIPANAGGFIGYWLSLFGTFAGVSARPASIWAGAVFVAVSFALYLAYKRRHTGPTEAELFYIFGLGSLALVALGRWKINLDRGSAVTYYHLFALPAYYGFLLMAARLAGPRLPRWAGVVPVALLAAALLPEWRESHVQLREQAMAYRNMIHAVQGWRMSEAVRLIGSPGHNQEIFFNYLPRLKAEDRYRRLSRDFHPYASSRIAPPVPSANPNTCNARYPNLVVLESALDKRADWTQGEPARPFHRYVGAARNPGNCDDTEISVSLVDAGGTVLCKAWDSHFVYWHYPSTEHADLVRSRFAFDFSCPPRGDGDHFLVSRDKSGRVLEAVKVPR